MNVRCLVIGGGPELDTTRCTIAQRPTPVWVKGGIAERRENLLAARDLVHLLYAYRCRRRVFMAMVNMEFDHAHYI
jgi:hypothetical protein